MYRKLKNILCHPSFLGFYIKDKGRVVIGWLFGFFILTVLLVAGIDMQTEMLDRNLAQNIADVIYYEDDLIDTVYNQGELSGKTKKLEYSTVTVYFNENSFSPSISDNIVLVFGKNTAYFYVSSVYVGQVEYSKMDYSSFSFSDMRSGDTEDRVVFYNMVYDVLQAGEITYRAIYFFSELGSILTLYFISFVVAYVLAFMTNPPIDRNTRFKLVGYDSIIFFFIIWLRYMFGVSWLEYIAAIFPSLFVLRTFGHIRKIVIKKGGNPNDNQRGN